MDVDVAVEFDVPFPAVVVGRPLRISCDLVVVVLLPVPEEFPAIIVLYPKIVVDPTVDVCTESPVVIREMTGSVLMAEEDTVIVEA